MLAWHGMAWHGMKCLLIDPASIVCFHVSTHTCLPVHSLALPVVLQAATEFEAARRARNTGPAGLRRALASAAELPLPDPRGPTAVFEWFMDVDERRRKVGAIWGREGDRACRCCHASARLRGSAA
jgi:hypothetical protein